MARQTSGLLRFSGATDVEVTSKLFQGICAGVAVYLDGCTNVVITDCHFERVGHAVLAHNSTNVSVTNCTYRHLRGQRLGSTVGAFVQFDKCVGGEVSDSSGFCDPDEDGPIDIINVFESSGVSVLRNHIDGRGTSGSGSGIMVGDGGGSGHVVADNVLINPGQVGIGVAGGTDMQVLRNTIYGPQWASSNVGIYAHNYYPQVTPVMSGIVVADNIVDWRNAAGVVDGWWEGDNTGGVALSGNDFAASLDPDTL